MFCKSVQVFSINSIFFLHSYIQTCKFKFPQFLFEWASIYANVKVLQVRLQHSPDLEENVTFSTIIVHELCSNTAVNVTSYFLLFALQGNETTNGGADNSLCANILQIPAGSSRTYFCSPKVYGRYLYIRIPGITTLLTLCEVEVYSYLKSESKSVNLSSSLFCRYAWCFVCIFCIIFFCPLLNK